MRFSDFFFAYLFAGSLLLNLYLLFLVLPEKSRQIKHREEVAAFWSALANNWLTRFKTHSDERQVYDGDNH